MRRLRRSGLWLGVLAGILGLVMWVPPPVLAQGPGFAAQIQLALRRFAANASITNLTVTGTCTGCGGTSKVAQTVQTQTSAVLTGSTQIPFDDSIPQITEGDQYLSLAITPTSATNKLQFHLNIMATATTTPWVTVAVFQDSTANAVGSGAAFIGLSTAGTMIPVDFQMTAGTTSATTFTVRIGPSNAATVTVNGTNGVRRLGGVLYSSMTITETVP